MKKNDIFFIELNDMGISNKEICEIMNISRATSLLWKKRIGLPLIKGTGRKKRFDVNKINFIKEQMKNGEYKINSENIADILISHINGVINVRM